MSQSDNAHAPATNFIRQIVDKDLASGTITKAITRFPPEPNGYLHIGHAKSICLNFGLAEDVSGHCHLRFDDTNPTKEDQKYADAIVRDIQWLGFQWHGEIRHTSDYYEQLYQWAIKLIENGHAYVDSQSPEQMREMRGTLTEAGKNSPYRDRSISENLDLFTRMRAGEFANGEHILRAKIDMASPNIKMRDPAMYRILHHPHPRTGDVWPIYPMYDYAHGLSDAIEGITHSICTLEFEDHRPLYNWFIEKVSPPATPHQYEFSRLNLEYTVMSKRWLLKLVEDGLVSGWDDPRMPTISGMRRRGYPPEAIRGLCARIGVTKQNHYTEIELLESEVRDAMDAKAIRGFGILNPLKVTIQNYDGEEIISAKKHPKLDMGERQIGFSNTLWIEREDFAEVPEAGFKRLSIGGEVKLRYSYILKCEDVVRDATGEIIELIATIDLDRSRKFKGLGIIHFLSAAHAAPASFHCYDRLFNEPMPNPDDIEKALNANSLVIREGFIEPNLINLAAEQAIQLERMGYFVPDMDSTREKPIFNQTVSLKDNWKKG